MVKAGILHLDLVCYGNEPDGSCTVVGCHSPIGSESSPIIQYLESVGKGPCPPCNNVFYRKQHDDGFMQNFGGYMLKPGQYYGMLRTLSLYQRYRMDKIY